MRYVSALICAFMLIAVATTSMALDREASMIDEVQLRYRVYDQIDTAGVLGRGEIPLSFDDNWAFVIEGGWSRILERNVERESIWHFALGPKVELFENTRLTVVAQGDWTGNMEDFTALGGTVMLEQRLINVESKMSPYVQAAISFLDVGAAPWAENSDADYTSWVVHLVLGNDAMISENVALSTRAEWWRTMRNSQDATKDWADGWAIGLGLKYFLQE